MTNNYSFNSSFVLRASYNTGNGVESSLWMDLSAQDNVSVKWFAIDNHLVSEMLANVSQLALLYYMIAVDPTVTTQLASIKK